MTDRLTTEEAARNLRYAPNTLRRWRSEGRGPTYLKVGRMVWYKQADLDRWNKQAEIIVKPRRVI